MCVSYVKIISGFTRGSVTSGGVDGGSRGSWEFWEFWEFSDTDGVTVRESSSFIVPV